jgi:uncharacterized protein (TIGR03067 family)
MPPEQLIPAPGGWHAPSAIASQRSAVGESLPAKQMSARLSIWPWLLIIVFGLFGGSSSLADTPENPLVGRWILQRKGVAATFPYKLEWEFTKDKVIVRVLRGSSDRKEASRNSYTIDTTKSPKWITVIIAGEPHEVRMGIFRIVGEELHLKQSVGGGPRPLDFVDDYSILMKVDQQDGAANGSQPLRRETNQTPSAAVLAVGWDYLWGKWEEKGNPQTFFVFSLTNLVSSVNGTQEVWQVVVGTNLVAGLTVTKGAQKVEAKSIVKFNEMIFHLGQRSWLLKKVGSNDADFREELPNQPAKIPPAEK